jgi:putative transposase
MRPKKDTESSQLQLASEGMTSRAIQEVLLERSKQAAFAFGVELLEQEVEALCGAPFVRKGDDLCHRGGSEKTSLLLDGAKYGFRRPRVRNEDGEVDLEILEKLRDQDLFDTKIRSRMMLGATTRNYEGLIDSYAKKLSVSKSTVSRAFKRASQKDLDDINKADLKAETFVALLIDGVCFADRTVIGAVGVTADLRKIPLGIREGDTENSVVVKDLLANLIERGFRLHCARLLAVIDGGKALKKALHDVFGERVIIQRCYLHKYRNLTGYAPKRYHKQIHWRMKKMMGLVTFEDALKELVSFTQWLSEISLEAHSSMEEVGEELLALHKLGLTKELRKSLSSTNLIESLFSVVRLKTNRVNNWKKDPTQITRWVASAMKAHRPRMKRLSGYKHADILIEALGKRVDQEMKSEYKVAAN